MKVTSSYTPVLEWSGKGLIVGLISTKCPHCPLRRIGWSVELGSQTVPTDLQWCEVAGCWHRLASPENDRTPLDCAEHCNCCTKATSCNKAAARTAPKKNTTNPQKSLRSIKDPECPSPDFSCNQRAVWQYDFNWMRICILSVQPAWWRARKTLNTTVFVSRCHAVVIALIKIRPLHGYLGTSSLRRIHSYSPNSFKRQEWMLGTVQLVLR